MQAIGSLLTDRPYVIGFLVAFGVLAWAERGTLRMILWLASGTLFGHLAERVSVATGFPFGGYSYHPENFPNETWLGAVPLFASVSFAFVSYFAFSAARRLLAPWTGRGLGVTTRGEEALDRAPRTLVLAAVLATWLDTVMDPVSLLGRHWFLGDLYHYDPPGLHFGVPLSNYAGWLLTVGVIVATNQLFDGALVRAGVPAARGRRLPLESLWGIACCGGVLAFMLVVNVMLLARGTVPPDVPLGRILAWGLLSTALFAAWVTLLLRRGFALGTSPSLEAAARAAS